MTAHSLDQLLVEIERSRLECLLADRDAIRCGELLIEARLRVGGEDWRRWLAANLSLTPEAAHEFMERTREARDGR